MSQTFNKILSFTTTQHIEPNLPPAIKTNLNGKLCILNMGTETAFVGFFYLQLHECPMQVIS